MGAINDQEGNVAQITSMGELLIRLPQDQLDAIIASGGGGSTATVLNGAVAPGGGVGNDGDFYIDTTADAIYGPKTAGAWGAPTSLIGPQGPPGSGGGDHPDTDHTDLLPISGHTAESIPVASGGTSLVDLAVPASRLLGRKSSGGTAALTVAEVLTLLAVYTTAQTDSAIATAVANIIDSSPSALDTLNELAAALGDDPNFATTVTTALANKQPIDSDLTAIAGLATTAYGRGLLTAADLAALQAVLGPTGVPSATTYLRGDGSWNTPAGGGGGGAADVQIFTVGGTWNKPATGSTTRMLAWGAGGGGGAGRKGAAGTVRCGGGGGSGGGWSVMDYQTADLSASLAVVVGAGGTGGAAQTTNSTDGANGTAGGASYIGPSASDSKCYAGGGAAGSGGTAANGLAGGSSSGAGLYTTTAGGAASSSGGAGSAPGTTSGQATVGGGGGGGITTGNVAGAGGGSRLPSGAGNNLISGAGPVPGAGGAGGTASTAGNAIAGFNGLYGGGGGGGGAATDSVGNSGKGGDGGQGLVILVTW